MALLSRSYKHNPSLIHLLIDFSIDYFSLVQCLKEGDIVFGKVSYKRPFGIIVTLTMLEFGCNRDFTELDIQVLF